MIKVKSNNTNQISPFVSSLCAKAIAECNVPLEWIKNKDMLAMVKSEESDEKLTQDTPITSSKLLEKLKDRIKWKEFNPNKAGLFEGSFICREGGGGSI